MSLDAARAAITGPPRSFLLDGETYRLRRRGWAALLLWLPMEAWRDHLLWELMPRADGAALDARLFDEDDPLDLFDVRTVAERVVSAACGRPWWVAQRLLATAADRWVEVDGALRLRGIDLAVLCAASPPAACNAVYMLLVEAMDEKGRVKLDAELEVPPPGAAGPDALAAEGSLFMAALAGHRRGGAPRS